MQRTVSQVMDPNPFGFLPGESAVGALALLLGQGLSGAPVHARSGRVLGYLACRDLAAGADGHTVADRMTIPALVIHPGASLLQAAERFSEKRVTRLVVAEDGLLVGSLSTLDLVRCLPGLLTVRQQTPLPHFDAAHDVFWSDVLPLDEACAEGAPAHAGVLMISQSGALDPCFEHTGHLRDRLREMLTQCAMTGSRVRFAEVRDPRLARHIVEDLCRQSLPTNPIADGPSMCAKR